jgi:glycine betaine/proline transport system substrate-binding protein
MKHSMKRVLTALAVLVIASAVVLVGCQPSGQQAADGDEMQVEKAPVSIAYVEWARAVAITHVAGEILERQGFDVTLNSVANAAMWQSVASQDSDALLAAWLPATHQMFYGPQGEFSDQLVNLGPNYYGAKLGLVVPSYVEEASIPELVENAGKYGNEIIGIDPGAGMMQQTETAIDNDVYGLSAMTLVEGSGPTMTAALGQAIDNEEPIVVTGWRPHWKFGRWDLKILEDPENVYGETETINTMVREGLAEDNIAAYVFFEQFDWTEISLGPVLVNNQEGMDPAESAAQFVDNNIDQINELMPDRPYFTEM